MELTCGLRMRRTAMRVLSSGVRDGEAWSPPPAAAALGTDSAAVVAATVNSSLAAVKKGTDASLLRTRCRRCRCQ